MDRLMLLVVTGFLTACALVLLAAHGIGMF